LSRAGIRARPAEARDREVDRPVAGELREHPGEVDGAPSLAVRVGQQQVRRDQQRGERLAIPLGVDQDEALSRVRDRVRGQPYVGLLAQPTVRRRDDVHAEICQQSTDQSERPVDRLHLRPGEREPGFRKRGVEMSR
jgi:hypothetical protein